MIGVQSEEGFDAPIYVWQVLLIVSEIPDISLPLELLVYLIQQEVFTWRVNTDFEDFDV
jgi:hypothetical protein